MMFPKNDTNFSGEDLCSSCRFGYVNPLEGFVTNCDRTGEWVHNVGVCKDYEVYQDNN